MHDASGRNYSYNIRGNDVVGQIRITNNYQSGRIYFLKDHLGSIRMTLDASGTIIGYDDYYPFGSIMPERSMVSTLSGKYRFTGKERDSETGYDYFGARYYDSKFARWLSVDPLADKYPGWSPYNYTLNNPLKNVDPNGMESTEIQDPEEDEWVNKKRQENTWNYLKQTSNYIEKGAEIIITKISNLSDKLLKEMKDGSQEVVREGPSTLSSYSKSVTEVGLVGGIGFSAFSQPEIGLGILVGSSRISATLNGIASGLSTIEYLSNPSSVNAENLTKYMGATLLDLTGGNMINQAAVRTGEIIKETIKTIKYNPYILPFSF